jgi:hypothetical protein
MGWKRRVLGLVAAIGAVATPFDADACTCEWTGRSTDLAQELRNARESGNAIYSARTLSTHYEMPDPHASMVVLEAFAGEVKVGQVIHLQAGGLGDCTPSYDQGAL